LAGNPPSQKQSGSARKKGDLEVRAAEKLRNAWQWPCAFRKLEGRGLSRSSRRQGWNHLQTLRGKVDLRAGLRLVSGI
jgi:hypothetical protein